MNLGHISSDGRWIICSHGSYKLLIENNLLSLSCIFAAWQNRSLNCHFVHPNVYQVSNIFNPFFSCCFWQELQALQFHCQVIGDEVIIHLGFSFIYHLLKVLLSMSSFLFITFSTLISHDEADAYEFSLLL